MRTSRFGKVVLLIVFLMMGDITLSYANRPRIPEPSWKELERELVRQGVEVDDASLLEIISISSKASTNMKWMAIELLGLRRESAKSSETADQNKKAVINQFIDSEKDILLRETAALALARLGEKRGFTLLHDFMKMNPKEDRQIFLAARLADLGDPTGYSYVLKAISSSEPYLRYLSIGNMVPFVALSEHGKLNIQEVESPTEKILTLLSDENEMVRQEVLNNIPLIVRKGGDKFLIKKALADFVRVESRQEVRQFAKLLMNNL